jgi:hypothetical protein
MAAVELRANRLTRSVLAAAVLAGLAACGSGSANDDAGPSPGISIGTPALPAPTEVEPTDAGDVPIGPPNPTPATGSAGRSGPATTVPGPATATVVPDPPAGARPCPDAVAAALPGGGPAVLVAAYETSRFRLYYCRTSAGQLYYRGVSRIDPSGVVTLPATEIAGGYEARTTANGSAFVYRVASRALVVIQDGRVLRTDPVLRDL